MNRNLVEYFLPPFSPKGIPSGKEGGGGGLVSMQVALNYSN
jgi:GTPase involved in cell partitioning and DNA repair